MSLDKQLADAVEEPRHRAYRPVAPRSVEDTGLNFSFLVDLVLKTFFQGGQLRLTELSDRIKLPVGVLEPLIVFMRAERFCEVFRRGAAETDISYMLTDLGRQRANEAMDKSHYVGPAPVNLQAYVNQVERQSIGEMRVDRRKVEEAFSGVVLSERLLDLFGAAMNSGRAILVYGPGGSGKTFIAEQLVNLLSGYVYLPHAIEVDGEVIRLFDPLAHRPVEQAKAPVQGLDRLQTEDERWILCHRPVAMAGGELTLSMLDLEFEVNARFYNAPPQVKANNGLLIIDDLGRQLVSPRELLNRWIVPLDRRVDFLALHTGKKFKVPFDVNVVFSTNLLPSELADEAFLRRLGYKIYVGPVSEDDYQEIFMQVCARMKIPFSEAGLAHVLLHHKRDNRPLLACNPRDILGQVRDRAIYEGNTPEMSETLLDWAWQNYFATD